MPIRINTSSNTAAARLIARHLLLLSVLLMTSFKIAQAAQTTTPWPDYMSSLQPSLSESTVSAELPAGSEISRPAESIDSQKSQYSGRWYGWACVARLCDIRIAIEKVNRDAATIAYAGASSFAAPFQETGTGRFVGNELHMELSTDSSLKLRLRDQNTLEMSVWKPEGALLAAGVLTNRPFAYRRDVVRIATPWSDANGAQTLEMVVYNPKQPKSPRPTLLFNHGSTGTGTDPQAARWTATSPEIGQFFSQLGWQVLMPQRRGRGNSHGEYKEGLGKNGYSCDRTLSLAGFDYATQSLDAVMQHIADMPTVDPTQLLIGGVSRGGVLSIAYAASHTDRFSGVVNFVGGWMGEHCANIDEINSALFARGAKFPKPSLWLYAENDPYYSIAHSRSNFAAFKGAGGNGHFQSIVPPTGQSGHNLTAWPELWSPILRDYISTLAK